MSSRPPSHQLTHCYRFPHHHLGKTAHTIEAYAGTYGLSAYEHSQQDPEYVILPLFRGTILPDEFILIQPFQEQSSLGWEQFLGGRLSQKWARAYQVYTSEKVRMVRDASLWIKKVIVAMWAYSTTLWKFRNSIVHGASKEEEKEKRLEQLHQHVCHEYSLYESDPFLISPQFASLFTKKSINDRLCMDIDSLTCWLRSVEEAKWHQLHFRASLNSLRNWFFQPRSHQSLIPSKHVVHLSLENQIL
jgi:hypothetical protein